MKSKIITWILVLLLLAGAVFVYFKFYFVLGEGVKAGELNQIVYKGWVWKTYEGRLIQTGFRGAKKGTGIQSNEFNFSVADKEYNGMLPWRGMQKYVVYEILSISDNASVTSEIPYVVSGEEITL